VLIVYCKAKQSANQSKRCLVICNLYEAHAKLLKDDNFEEHHGSKSGLLDHYPSYAFVQLLSGNSPEEFINTPFGSTPKNSVLSCQALEYEKPRAHGSTQETIQELPIGILDNAPCVFEIE